MRAAAFLRILANIFLLGWLVGLLVTTYRMIRAFQSMQINQPLKPDEVLADGISYALCATSLGFLLFPLGAILHWIVAKRTGIFPPWCRQSLFWSSVLFMCLGFPVGTLIGGIVLWQLYTSKAFTTTVGRSHSADCYT